MRIGDLWRYPVKSMVGERLTRVDLDTAGVVGDRAYAVIDRGDGKVASAKNPRKWRSLLGCRAEVVNEPAGGASAPPVRISFPDGPPVPRTDPDIRDNFCPAPGPA